MACLAAVELVRARRATPESAESKESAEKQATILLFLGLEAGQGEIHPLLRQIQHAGAGAGRKDLEAGRPILGYTALTNTSL